MQLMLGIYEFPSHEELEAATGGIETPSYVRGYRLTT
jgi:hypothetical protein